MQEVFAADAFLWGFVVAWFKSDKTGDQGFVKGQQRAMKTFNKKTGATGPTESAMAVAGKVGVAMAAAGTFRAATAGTTRTATAGTSGMATAGMGGMVMAQQGTATKKRGMVPAKTPATGAATMVAPAPAPAEMQVQPAASGSRHPAPAYHLVGPKPPAITVTPRPRELQSSSGSDEEFQNEDPAKESDSDIAATIPRMKQKWDNIARGCTPLQGSLRMMPCAQCVRLGRDCWEQVNGKSACYYCRRGKVRCDPEDGDRGQRTKKAESGSARRKGKQV